MSKHTPGDWVTWYELDEDGLITTAGVDTGDRAANICVTTENVEAADHDVNAANAQIVADTELIAAAPKMLKAIDKALAYFGNVNTYEWSEVLQALVDARAAASDEHTAEELMGMMDGAAAFSPEELEGAVFEHEELLATLKMSHYYYNAFRDSTPKGSTELDDIKFIKATIDKFKQREVDPS